MCRSSLKLAAVPMLFIAAAGCAEVGDSYPDVFRTDAQDFSDIDAGATDLPWDMTEMPTDTSGDPDVTPGEVPDLPPEGADIVDATPDDPPPEDVPADIGPGTCTPSDFPRQTMCSPGYKCVLGVSIGCTPTAACDIPGAQGENQICAGSGISDNCQIGYICLGDGVESRCRKFCATDSDCFGGGSGCVMKIVTLTCTDGLTGVNVCTHGCDYFYQSGCQPGQACRFIVPEGSSNAYSDCSRAGSGTQGSTCRGSTDCAAGFDCFHVDYGGGDIRDECLKICNYSGGYPTCPSGYTCTRNEVWPLPIGACL